MIFLYIILFCIFNFFIYLIGKSLNVFLKFNNNLIYIDLVYGVFLIGFISFFLNFFIGLDNLIVKLLIFSIIIISLKNLSLNKFKDYILLFILSILIFPIIIYMGPGYDGGLYHLPHQNLIKHEKIIFGLGNIRRFGFGSINEYISSLLWVKENLILLKFIQGTYFLIFFCFIIENVNKLNINIKIILPIIFLLPLLQRYFTLAYTFTDIPTTIFYLLSFVHGYKFFLMKTVEKIQFNKDITTFLILLFLTISMKPTGSLILFYAFGIFLFIIYKFRFSFKYFLNYHWIYLIFFLWFIKNLISTGCLIYPIKLTCFTFLDWSSHQNAIIEFLSAKSFAREPFAGNEPLYSWKWLTDYWINVYDKFIIGFIVTNIFILLHLYLYSYLYKKKSYYLLKISTVFSFFIITLFFQESGLVIFNKFFISIKETLFENKFLLLLIFIITFSLLIIQIKLNKNKIELYLIFSLFFIISSLFLWFLNSPVPRFGLFLFFCLSILSVFLLSNFKNEIKIKDLKIQNALIICLLYYLLFISSQATKTENFYTLKNLEEIYWVDIIKNKNFDYPKKGHSSKEEEIIPDIGLIERTNYGYKPNTSDQCWFKLKCYPYKDVIIYNKILSYKFMKLVDE